jgi:glycerol transport system ATP-binding protein
VTLRRIEDVGRHRIVRADLFGSAFNLIEEGMAIGADMTRVAFAPDKINVYADDWRALGRAA